MLRFAPVLLVVLSACASACAAPSRPTAPVVPGHSPPLPALAADTVELDRELDLLLHASPKDVASVADAVSARISPWQRALQKARKERLVSFFVVPRDVTRPWDRIESRRIETAVLERLERETDPNARARLYVLLAEVGSDPASARLTAKLESTTDDAETLLVMRALETLHGLPAFFEPHSLACGEPGSPAETARIVAAHEAGQARARAEGRQKLLAWLDANEGQPRERRIGQAFAAWDAKRWVALPDRSVEGIDFDTVLVYASVVRLGAYAVPSLSVRRDQHPRFDVLLAAVNGSVEEPRMRALLATSEHAVFPIEAIAVARDRRFTAELDQRQYSRDNDVAAAASKALAAVLGPEAIPLLQAAATKNPDNYTAKYAAESLAALAAADH
jgi:hypothetical protein